MSETDEDGEELKEGYITDYISGRPIKATPEELEAVQVFSKRLVEDFAYSKDQIQTRPQIRVRRRPSGKDDAKGYPIDIAVFKDSKKQFDDLFMVVECKQKKRQDGLKQLKIYMDLCPAKIGVWFNGKEHLYLLKVVTPENSIQYIEIPTIPKKNQRIEDIGKYKRKDLQPAKNLKAIFNDMRNHLAGNITGITRDEAIAEQIINILFCKIYDEINTDLDDEVTFRVGINEPKENVRKRITDLFDKQVKQEYNDVFDKSDVIKLDGDSITYIVGELQNFLVIKADRDAIGDAFEVFIGPALRGSEGQFFTPRNIVKMAIEIIDPEPNETIIDPACGSGGFLIVALEYIWKKLDIEAQRKGWSQTILDSKKREAASRYFRGIDKDSFLAKVTKSYMAIVGDGRSGIFCENSLKPFKEWATNVNTSIKPNSFKVLITNPPFGAKIPIKGETLLSQFDLGYKWKYDESSNKWNKINKLTDKQPPQILFIERCIQLLEDGGRMAIVLPDGLLGNITDGYIRQFILENCKIIGVIDCPVETFQPSTSTKTSILILQKLKHKEGNYPIFMAVAKKCGHDRRGNLLTPEGKDVPDDFPQIIQEFKKFRSDENVVF
jgi:type I restriction enzyme M protein